MRQEKPRRKPRTKRQTPRFVARDWKSAAANDDTEIGEPEPLAAPKRRPRRPRKTA